MPDMENNVGKLLVTVVPQELRVSTKELEPSVDADIATFDKYFQSLGNDPLVRSEKAIIKTWIWWHLHAADKSEPSL